MKKSLKITLIVLGVLVGIIALDTLQAKMFDNSPLLKIRDNLSDAVYVDKGIFVNHYHCDNEKVTTWKGSKYDCPMPEIDYLQDTYNQVSDYFADINVNHDNLVGFSLDKDRKVVIVKLINNNQEEQEKFLKQTNANSKYIEFEQNVLNIDLVTDFYITKLELQNGIRFNDYYENNNRKIYLAGNIEEFYIKDQDGDITLKKYLSTAYQTFDDGIKHITDKLDKFATYLDGGTTVYKSKGKDITLIVCNKLYGNKNIYIGDYSLGYTDDMCN